MLINIPCAGAEFNMKGGTYYIRVYDNDEGDNDTAMDRYINNFSGNPLPPLAMEE